MSPAGADRGQSTVEFALVAPLVVLCTMTLLGTVGLCLDATRLDDVARNAVRSAVTADDPSRAAEAVAREFRVAASTSVNDRTGIVTVTVRLVRPLPIPVLGRLVPRVSLRGSASMMREPPIVLG